MSISPAAGSVDLLLRLSETDLDCRNALHQALKRGLDLALGYDTGADLVYEAAPGSGEAEVPAA